jgi:hypothetical protein
MAHIVEVDQSNRVDESGDTYMAFSNGISWAIKVPSRVKQAGLGALRARGKPRRRAEMLLFAACVFLLLEDHLDQLQRIIIDNEYDGHEADIRSFLFEYIKKREPGFEIGRIAVRSIGKKSRAHNLAWSARRGEREVNRILSEAELLAVVA